MAVDTILITEQVTDLTVTSTNNIAIDLTTDDVSVTVNNIALPINYTDAQNVAFTPYNTITAGATVEEGDTWYDTDDNQLKVYRETSSGVFAWVPIIVGNESPDSDTLDAGAF